MTFLQRAALVSALTGCATLAHANTITYNLTANTSAAGTLAGTLEVDSASGRVTAADLTLNDAVLGSPHFTTVGLTSAYNGLSQDYVSGRSSGWQNYGGQVGLFFDTANLGANTLSLCTAAAVCGTQGFERSYVQVYSWLGNLSFDLSGGSLTLAGASPATPTTATPEPSSLALLGTGILGMAGLLLVWPSRFVSGLQPRFKTSA